MAYHSTSYRCDWEGMSRVMETYLEQRKKYYQDLQEDNECMYADFFLAFGTAMVQKLLEFCQHWQSYSQHGNGD
jgi:hypothetical protein